jgi:site-specific DNA-adenine methylase
LKLDDIETIVEPFCGSAAISYKLYLDHPNKFNYVLNDNSPDLIRLYNLIKTQDVNIFVQEINNFKATITNKEEYMTMCKKKDKTIYEWFIMHRYYNLRAGLYDSNMHKKEYNLNKEQLKFIKFIKDPRVQITCDNWQTSFDQYKDNEHALIMMDPPYLQSCNDFYEDARVNVYEHLYYNRIESFKSQITLILEKNWIINLLFQNNFKFTYEKMYQPTKKKTQHYIITNSLETQSPVLN